MAVTYHEVLASVALRVNALTGADKTTLESSYNIRPLTTTQFQSTIFPFSDFRTAILSAEQKLAQVIAKSDDDGHRSFIMGTTSALASGAILPSTSSTGQTIIGHFGNVLDGADTTISCAPQPVQIIRRRLATPTLWKIPVYNFAFVGNRIFHTRTTVILECPIYDYAIRKTAYNANGNMLLADDMMEALICGGLSLLIRDDEFGGQAATYSAYFKDVLDSFNPRKQAA